MDQKALDELVGVGELKRVIIHLNESFFVAEENGA